MKRIIGFITFVAFASLQACVPPVQFNEPQPAGEKNLDAFPEKLRGNYLNEADSSVLTITQKLMVRHYSSLLKESKKDLDSLFQLTNDSTITYRETGKKSKVFVNGDTISGYIHTDDTLFNISEQYVLRKFKGFYFLNTAFSNSWEVQMLDLSNGKLTLGEIPSREGLEKLKQISTSVVDTASGNVQLTNDQFSEFVKEGGFYNTAEFKRIK